MFHFIKSLFVSNEEQTARERLQEHLEHTEKIYNDAVAKESANVKTLEIPELIVPAEEDNWDTCDNNGREAMTVAFPSIAGKRTHFRSDDNRHLFADMGVKNANNDDKLRQRIETVSASPPKEIMDYLDEKRNCSITTSIMSSDKKGCVVELNGRCFHISYSDVEMKYMPYSEDRVIVDCNIDISSNELGEEVETLRPLLVAPYGLLTEQRCTVRRVDQHGGQLNDNIEFLHDYLVERKNLAVGDIVYADLVPSVSDECEYRAIRIQLKSEVKAKRDDDCPPLSECNNWRQRSGKKVNPVISVSPNQVAQIHATFTRKLTTFLIRNKADNEIYMSSIQIVPARGPIKVYLNEPNLSRGFIIPAKEEVNIAFWVTANTPCEREVAITFQFRTFRIERLIKVTVGSGAPMENGDDEITAQISNVKLPRQQLERCYAHKVWLANTRVDATAPKISLARFVHEHIGLFPIPRELRATYLLGTTRLAVIDDIERLVPCLSESLSMKNYTARFSALLFLEELTCFVELRKLDMERGHFRVVGEHLFLHIENLGDRLISVGVGDSVRASQWWTDRVGEGPRTTCWDGLIVKAMHDGVLLKFHSSFHNSYKGESYRLEFFYSRYPFRKLHHAVHRSVKCLGPTFLFPTKVVTRPSPLLTARLDAEGNLLVDDSICQWYNPHLNVFQKKGVRNILRGELMGMAHIVFGPPGTGKTSTLLETALQIIKLMPHAHVLIGSPANATADLILTRLVASGLVTRQSIIRLISQNYFDKALIPEPLLPYCGTLDMAKPGTNDSKYEVLESGMQLNCRADFLLGFRIIVSTCATLGNMMQMHFPPRHLTHVLIDESGQCAEPESLMVFTQCVPQHSQYVLFGDPRQLHGIVMDKYAGDNGLNLSLLERLLTFAPYHKGEKPANADSSGYDERIVTKLLYNYRSHPSILKVYSHLFYDGELRPTIDLETSREAIALRALQTLLPVSKSGRCAPKHGAFFFGLESHNEQSSDSPSWFNRIEAQKIYLFTLALYDKGCKALDIGIITPYAKQVKLLRSLFAVSEVDVPKIGTVEDFLGLERDIILLSTVRATREPNDASLRLSLGFVRCPRRINVAISRARYLLCVFGNPNVLALDPCWRALIRYCVDCNAYSGIKLDTNLFTDDGDVVIPP